MTQKKLYIFLAVACIAGYVWLFCSYTIQGNGPGICLFKLATDIPCPACGSTRSILALFQGNIADSWAFNPNGLFLAVGIVLLPFWLLYDLLLKKNSCYRFYQWCEQKLHNKMFFSIILFIVILNWIWNIYKGV